jgi:hypothetical protein
MKGIKVLQNKANEQRKRLKKKDKKLSKSSPMIVWSQN